MYLMYTFQDVYVEIWNEVGRVLNLRLYMRTEGNIISFVNIKPIILFNFFDMFCHSAHKTNSNWYQHKCVIKQTSN